MSMGMYNVIQSYIVLRIFWKFKKLRNKDICQTTNKFYVMPNYLNNLRNYIIVQHNYKRIRLKTIY